MDETNKSVSLCFIIPYFGKLPKTMQIFLDSAACNEQYKWLLFTDDLGNYRYPENVHVQYMSFEQMQDRIQKAFSFPISIDTPKKLCDYKPAYGYIFQEELQEYQYWGYCDLDMILGKLDSFITNSYLARFDKVFTLGHMSIFRNVAEINTVFMKDLKSTRAKYTSYKDVFQNKSNLVFDEWPENIVNINVLAEQEGLRISGDWPMVDILPHRSSFKESFFYYDDHRWSDGKGPNILVYKNNNRIFKAWIDSSGQVETQEVLYAHIQKRELSTKKYKGYSSNFIIIPNKIISTEKVDALTLKKFLSMGRVRRLFKIDELRWKHALAKGIWKHRLRKYLKIG